MSRTLAIFALGLAAAPTTWAAENAGDPITRQDLECTPPALSDQDHEWAKKLYSAHVGFESLYKALDARCKTKGFLDRLREAVVGPDKVTSDDIVDAAAPKSLSEKLTDFANRTKRRIENALESDEDRAKRVQKSMKEGIYVEGEFDKDGLPANHGITVDQDGTVRRGEFQQGKLHGNGQEITPDGTLQAGTYAGGSLTGEGARQNPEGTTLEGTFDNGKPVGEMIATFPDGHRERQDWHDDGTMTYVGRVDPILKGVPQPEGPPPLTRDEDEGAALLQAALDEADQAEAGRPAREAAAAERARQDAAAEAQRQEQLALQQHQQALQAEQQRQQRDRNTSTLFNVIAGVANAYVAAKTGDTSTAIPSIPVPAATPPAAAYRGTTTPAPAANVDNSRKLVQTMSCVRFEAKPFPPSDHDHKYRHYEYTSSCGVQVKVCDPITNGNWGCGIGLKPGAHDGSWDRTVNVDRYGGQMIVCPEYVDGKMVFFDRNTRQCHL